MGIGQELRDVLNEETVNRILQEALARGGDFADIFAEQRFRTLIVLDDGKLDSITYGYPRGAGVRIYYRNQTGYAFSDSVDYNALLDSARVASRIVQNQSRSTPLDVASKIIRPPFTIANPASMMPESAKFEIVQRMDAAARATDPRIGSVRVEYMDEVRDILVGTSDGGYAMDRQYLVSVLCAPAARSGGNRAFGLEGLGGRVDASYFARVSPEGAAAKAAEQAARLLDAGPPPFGAMPVVIGPGSTGMLIHESLGHALEGDGIFRGTSIVAGLAGTRIASPLLRVVDDGTWANGRGSYAIDDEGILGQRTVLVDAGILRSYALDRQSASVLGLQSTGNGRRMSYRSQPLPRLTNTYVDRGASDPASLLGGIAKGLFVAQLGNGSVNPISGNFNFTVREGYLIENGAITRPVRGAAIVGNALETLKRIEGVGNDLVVDSTRATCTKDGQTIPVGVGQPTIRFSSMTVGGSST